MDKPAHRRMRPLLGTFVEIAVRAPEPLAETAIASAFAAIEQIQRHMSFHDGDSDLSRINLHAWRRPVSVSSDIFRVLCHTRHIARRSNGLFDISIGGRLVAEGRLPDHGFPALDAEGWDALELLPRLRVRLKRPVVLTLDGIAKGYAVDCAVQTLFTHGITRGLVNAGGDLRLFGPDALPIAVREASGAITPLGEWSNTAMATSAVGLSAEDQARFPSCIVTPHGCDGLACPHFNQCPRAWTVLADEAWRADALTKVAALAPEAGRAARIARLGGRLIAHDFGRGE
ncbi:MAG: FAD:protein FMN transferase [Halothiobacillaceae bacterium]|nr:FAD:protein FMN transferase [Halothiobacillaceae bacterium]